MKKEKVVLSFFAVIFGLLVAGTVYFVYQYTKSISPAKIPTITISNPTPTPQSAVPLIIDQPLDESVTSTKTLTLNGKTDPSATLVLLTGTDNQITTPAANGNFSLTTTISTGVNQIFLTAIAPNGQETQKELTVTYSTEEF